MLFCGFMGWMGTTTYVWICIVSALVLGILFGIILFKNIKVVLVLNGIVFGFLLGSFAYGLTAYFFEWKSFWALLIIAIVTAVVCGIISCKFATTLVIWGTAFLGSYLFMRSIASIVEPDFMTEAEVITKLKNDEEIVFPSAYWFYLIFFVLCFLFSVIWQTKMLEMLDKEDRWDGKHVWQKDHEELKEGDEFQRDR